MQNTSTRQPLSAVIIACNAASQLPLCIQSLRVAEEILVVDSGSSDHTPEIATQNGARVLHQAWLGFGKQKQFAVEQATHDWVLCLDADEYLSEGLIAEIKALMTAPACKAYEMPRRNYFMGKWLAHGEGYPDRHVRLFHRRYARWSEDEVHEKVVGDYGKLGRLRNDLMHRSEQSLTSYLDKQNRYTSLQAEALFYRGEKPSISKLILSPGWRFLKFYIIRLGFLDGLAGLTHISIGCFNSFIKYAKLAQRYKEAQQ